MIFRYKFQLVLFSFQMIKTEKYWCSMSFSFFFIVNMVCRHQHGWRQRKFLSFELSRCLKNAFSKHFPHVKDLYSMLWGQKFRVRIVQSDWYRPEKDVYDKLIKFWWWVIDTVENKVSISQDFVLDKVNIINFSRRRFISYRNQSIDLQNKSMDSFLYEKYPRHVKILLTILKYYWEKKTRTTSNVFDSK